MSNDELKAKPTRRRSLIFLIVGLMAVCGVCGFISLLVPNREPESESVAERSAEVEETFEQNAGGEPTALPRATETAEPTSTPRPTDTPRPTNTPVPTPTPTRPPDPIVLTGTGDSIIEVEKWTGPAIVHIIGNSSARHFAVINYDAAGVYLDLLVNTTEPYDGVRPLDFFDGQQTTRFEVTATGAWQIEVLPLLEQATPVEVPGRIEGMGDAVLLLLGEADLAAISGNAAGRHFAVHSYGSSADLLVNTTEPYDGQVLVPPRGRVLVVTAEGPWSIELTGR